MVKNATSYSGNGLRDWLVQRVSAVILGAYTVFMFGYFCCNPDFSQAALQGLFSNVCMKVATLITLLALILHAWIGIWTIFTDYVKPVCVRLFLEVAVILALVWYFIWGLIILW